MANALVSSEIQDLVYLIQVSGLDSTIKISLIQTLLAEGLSDFLREQITAYCMEDLRKADPDLVKRVQQLLQNDPGSAQSVTASV